MDYVNMNRMKQSENSKRRERSGKIVPGAMKKGEEIVENLDIRIMVAELGLKYKDIAREMGIHPPWLCRLMKKPLSLKDRVRIIDAIERLK